MYWRKYIVSLLLCMAWPAFGWQVKVVDDQIQVSSAENYRAVQVYLAWFDMDLPLAQAISTWTLDAHWQMGVRPFVADPIDITPFDPISVDSLPRECAPEHRCFVALLATAAAADVLDASTWQASAILPLSPKAAFERLPGQIGFSNLSDSRFYNDVVLDEVVGSGLDAAAPAAAPTATNDADKANDATSANSSNTEKPDIFRYIDDKLLYADRKSVV